MEREEDYWYRRGREDERKKWVELCEEYRDIANGKVIICIDALLCGTQQERKIKTQSWIGKLLKRFGRYINLVK